MIEVPLINELREIRRRLSEEQHCDPARYAAMLRRVSANLPGNYVSASIWHEESRISRQPPRD